VKNLLEIKDLKVTFPTDDGFVHAVDGVSMLQLLVNLALERLSPPCL